MSFFVPAGDPEPEGAVDLLLGLMFLAYATVGTLILIRQPRNRVGWLVGAVGFFPLVSGLTDVDLQRAPDWRLADVARWYGNWYFIAASGDAAVALPVVPRRPAGITAMALASVARRRRPRGRGRPLHGRAGGLRHGLRTVVNPFQPAVLRPFSVCSR